MGHVVLTTIFDVSCMGLMLITLGSMLFILFMHKWWVQHIHNTRNYLPVLYWDQCDPQNLYPGEHLCIFSISCLVSWKYMCLSYLRILLFTLDAFTVHDSQLYVPLYSWIVAIIYLESAVCTLKGTAFLIVREATHVLSSLHYVQWLWTLISLNLSKMHNMWAYLILLALCPWFDWK